MVQIDYLKLQAEYGGQFVAHRQGQVVASAPTYEALQRRLEALSVQDEEIIIEYVERPDHAYVYRTPPGA